VSPEFLQNAVVTLVALGAGGVVVRRVLGVGAPRSRPPGCAKCASGHDACGSTAPAATGGIVEHPVVLIRSSSRARLS